MPLAQTEAGPLIETTGAGVTVTVVGDDVALQPAAFVTVTLKLPAVETVIDCVVAPFDHVYVAMPDGADKVTLSPAQNVVGPLAVIVTAGGDATLTVVGVDVALQPAAFVTVTE